MSNNYVKNGSFDADRISVTKLAGWTNDIIIGSNPIANTSTARTSKYALSLAGSSGQSARLCQNATLPDGTYTFEAQVRMSAGAKRQMFATSGGETRSIEMVAGSTVWTKVSLTDIQVTGGAVEIGFIYIILGHVRQEMSVV